VLLLNPKLPESGFVVYDDDFTWSMLVNLKYNIISNSLVTILSYKRGDSKF
jgi:hypothetical protein